MSNFKKELYKNWRISFKYLFMAFMFFAVVRVSSSAMAGHDTNVSMESIALSLMIAFVGAGALSFLIAWYSVKKEMKE